jgi:hypothetical protein
VLAELLPCSCGRTATVTWTESASPDKRVASWRCECGQTTERRLRPGPDDGLGVAARDDSEALMRQVALVFMRIEEGLRRMEPAGEMEPTTLALESARAGLVWARGLLSRAFRGLTATDARRPFLRDVIAEAGASSEELGRRDLSGAGDLVASAARTLNAMVALEQAAKTESERARRD